MTKAKEALERLNLLINGRGFINHKAETYIENNQETIRKALELLDKVESGGVTTNWMIDSGLCEKYILIERE